MNNITQETKEALAVALNHLLNSTKIAEERMALFSQFKNVTGEERVEILAKIQSLRDKVADAQLLLQLYVG